MRTALRLGVLAVAVCVAGARAEDKPKSDESPAKPPEGFILSGDSFVPYAAQAALGVPEQRQQDDDRERNA